MSKRRRARSAVRARPKRAAKARAEAPSAARAPGQSSVRSPARPRSAPAALVAEPVRTGSWASPRVRALLAVLAVVAAALFVYGPVLDGGFQWDDKELIRDNPDLRTAEGLERIWLEPSRTRVRHYFPLSSTAFWLEYRAFGEETRGYHVVNLVLHVVNALLVWALARALRVPGGAPAALVFCAHAAHASSVAWIIELKNLMLVAFFVLALMAWIRWLERPRPGAYALALLAFALAALSKSTAVVFPAVALLVPWLRRGRLAWRQAVAVLPFAALGGVLALVEVTRHAGGGGFGLSLAERVLVAGRAFWFYCGKLAWPATHLGVYPKWSVEAGDPLPWAWPLAALALLAVAWLARGRLGRGVPAALAFFALGLAPILGLVEYSVMDYAFVHDHHLYLPSIGPLLLLGAGIAVLHRRAPWAGAAALAVVLVPNLAWARSHADLFRDVETYTRHDLARNPDAFPAHVNLAVEHVEQGRPRAAVPHFEAAIALRPDVALAHGGLGAARLELGDVEGGLRSVRRALELDPGNATFHNTLGVAHGRAGRIREALECFERALALEPGSEQVRANLEQARELLGE